MYYYHLCTFSLFLIFILFLYNFIEKVQKFKFLVIFANELPTK